MSTTTINSEITRISTAKADIKSVLATKGVNVPNSARLDRYASYIDTIGTLVPTPGDTPVLENAGMKRIKGTTMATTDVSLTIPVAGTYRFKWMGVRSSSSGTSQSQLYLTRNGETSAIGTPAKTFSNGYLTDAVLEYACEVGDVITLYCKAGNSSYYMTCGKLTACVNQTFFFNDETQQ